MSSDSLRKVHRRSKPLLSNAWLSHLVAFVLGCTVTSFWHTTRHGLPSSTNNNNDNNHLIRAASTTADDSDCEISLGAYKGSEYRSASQTIGNPKCLVESKFLKVQQHAVQFAPHDPIITDWLWIDYHDRINVLVQAADATNEFLVFSQSKYALEGRVSAKCLRDSNRTASLSLGFVGWT